jgi:enoyl-CoA hydratase/carnithine racemase
MLIYTGDTIAADEAFRLSLVDKVSSKPALRAEVTKIAPRMSRVARNPQSALRNVRVALPRPGDCAIEVRRNVSCPQRQCDWFC